jgi:hypothetical protein
MGWWSEKCNHFTTAPRPTASRWRSALTWVRGYYSGQMARQAPAPPRIYGKRLELIEGCLATVQIKPVAYKGTSRYYAICISAKTLPLPLFRLTSLRVRAGTAQLLFVLREYLSPWEITFKFCRQQRDFLACSSSLILFGVGSRLSPPSLSFHPLNFIVLKDASSTHLNASKIKHQCLQCYPQSTTLPLYLR